MSRLKKKSSCLMLTILLMGAASVNAQVLIGENGTGKPHETAILELAPVENNLGLLLPKVQLSDDVNNFLLVQEAEGMDMATVKKAATGMVVYNEASVLYGKGLYVWNGIAWNSLRNVCPRVVYDRDGNEYPTGWFGKAGCWMTQNLRYIGELSTSNYAYPGAGTQAANKQAFDSHKEYGLLYNQTVTPMAVVQKDKDKDKDEGGGAVNPPLSDQSICPDGWHVASDADWTALERAIANDDKCRYSEEDPLNRAAGRKMKSKTKVDGVTANPDGASYKRNKNGFDVLLVGTLDSKGPVDYGKRAYFRSSPNQGYMQYRRLEAFSDAVTQGSCGLTEMYSVRCKKSGN